jgi:Asp-tRNA(Asn)/Glu-tRNA(Gln) amidotransferase C subunit
LELANFVSSTILKGSFLLKLSRLHLHRHHIDELQKRALEIKELFDVSQQTQIEALDVHLVETKLHLGEIERYYFYSLK